MEKLYEAIASEIDAKWLIEHTETLWRIELGPRSGDHKQAAPFATWGRWA